MNKLHIVPLLLLMIFNTCQGYLDEKGVPQPGLFGFRGLQKNIYCVVTFDWSREKSMLEAFEKTLNNPLDQNALKTFKEKFYAEDCGRHPHLLQKAIENNRADLLKFMHEKGLNVKDTYKEYCIDRAAEKTYALKYPLHWLVQEYGDRSLETIAVMTAVLKFNPEEKDNLGDTLLHKATQKHVFELQKKLRSSNAVRERNALGNTPLHEAASAKSENGLQSLNELLELETLDPDVSNNMGDTPLFTAARQNNVEAARALLKKGSKTSQKNNEQDSAIHYAARVQPPSEAEALFEELLQAEDFNAEAVDYDGKRVLDINDWQEECYCNPPKDGELIAPEILEKRLRECALMKNRKKKVTERLDRNYISLYAQKLNQLNQEVEQHLMEETELVKKTKEEEERKAQEALAKTQVLEKEETKLHEQLNEFQRTKNEPLEKVTELLKNRKTE